jgi:acetyl-CoA synthetase
VSSTSAYNCLDRHVEAGRGDKVAFHWEGEPGDTRTITYADLLDEVQRFANVLKGLGVAQGDRVAIYMPMIPELPVAMLACARIGAAHSVIFGGFSPTRSSTAVNDADAKVIITADAGYRRGEPSMLKPNVDAALAGAPVGRARRGGRPLRHRRRHGRGPRPLVARAHGRPPTPTARPSRWTAEQLLYLLYTSGTTAKPKGIMHTTGGYLTQVAFTHKVRVRPEARDRRLLVRGRHRLGHRPQLHRLRARSPTAPPR